MFCQATSRSSAEARPLPITETGYKSCFIDWRQLKEAGGPVAFIEGWLARETQSKAWRRQAAVAKIVAAVIAGATPAVTFPTAAEAFSARQCLVIQGAFTDYFRVNAANFSNEDRAELRKLNDWIGRDCQGNVNLAPREEVRAAVYALQTALAGHTNPELRVQLNGRITLG